MAHIRPPKFVHVLYRTRRYEKMIEWYKIVFDATVLHQDPALAFLTYDDEHHRLAMVQVPANDEVSKETRLGLPGLDHVAYTLSSLEELLSTYKRLKADDIVPVWPINHGLTTSMYYADPDGNQMEFQVDSYKSSEEADAFMNTHWDTNPVGVEFDPEAWLARLRAGTPESECLLRRVHEPASPIRGEIAELARGD